MESHQQMLPSNMDHHAKQPTNIGSHQTKLPTLPGRDSYERMNFLVQGAMTTLAKTPHNIELVRHYMKSVHGIKSKKVLRWSREMKHSYCSGCHMLLVAGITTQVRVKANRRLVSTCLSCNSVKRISTNKPKKKKMAADLKDSV